ncbi:CDP-alcohol phosphatidyltransferase family protein [Salinigranum sp. GCM10025319]|uniref:CDP-alcohol phosphatidyltransferase family protein n=1 Tax=Salinigranum sp. GCM10025319 TaxID=3252687 RepID=UPI003606591F
MSDENRSALRRIEEFDSRDRAERVVRSTTGENMISNLTGADWLSLTALFWAWVAALLVIGGEPNWGILAMFAGILFDKADGYWARRQGIDSDFGRAIDSFIDVFVYLVTAALLYHTVLAPHPVVGFVVGFVILLFGGLRLVRHNAEGFGDEGGTSYYVGTTVVHTNVVVLTAYLLEAFVGPWNGWIAAVVVAVCPLMTSRYRAYKTAFGHWLVGIGGVVTIALVLALEFGLV